eukprot:comp98756_c0_seq1/m.48709 comp98756_c0_seq1/g.48709  ORF comp98756_c0_seq1/g.48709 comp98756_c0_seq1/m.48709 type:complete len:294 (-) comp98756_c0_seq1:270-1151(-)
MSLVETTNMNYELSKGPTTGSISHSHTKAPQIYVDECSLKRQVRREITLSKVSGESFGAVLTTHHFRVFVVYVFQLTKNRQYTAAYRAGLNFGDEVVAINRHYVTELDEQQMTDMLTNSDVLFLEVVDNPNAEHHSTKIVPKDRNFGIQEYSKGEIVRVAAGSPADRAGLRPGSTVLSVNGKSALGFTDRQVIDALTSAFHCGGEVHLTTMKEELADRLLAAMEETLMTVDSPFAPNEMIDHDFSLLSLGLQTQNPAFALLDRLVLFDVTSPMPPRDFQSEGLIELVSELISG